VPRRSQPTRAVPTFFAQDHHGVLAVVADGVEVQVEPGLAGGQLETAHPLPRGAPAPPPPPPGQPPWRHGRKHSFQPAVSGPTLATVTVVDASSEGRTSGVLGIRPTAAGRRDDLR
jgi:hypothetical protein